MTYPGLLAELTHFLPVESTVCMKKNRAGRKMFVSSPGPQIKVLLALGAVAAFDLRVMKMMQSIKSSKSFLNMFIEDEDTFSRGRVHLSSFPRNGHAFKNTNDTFHHILTFISGSVCKPTPRHPREKIFATQT